MNSIDPQHESKHPDDKHPDVQSDPASGAEDVPDWSDEGGATPTGPATHTNEEWDED
jgi:hypothetical protein